MKKSTTAEATEPSYDRLHKSALPRISYNRAMSSYFLTSSGQAQTIEVASVEEFTQLVRSCKLPPRSNQRVSQVLKSCQAGLDYRQNLDKWYVLNELIMAGAAVPMFATMEQATQSLLQPMEVQAR